MAHHPRSFGRINDIDTLEFVREITSGNRSALSRAITLIESSRPDHQKKAHEILDHCLQHRTSSLRIGITGPPGVGKSTLIESLGLEILNNPDNRLAVLTIDPSSQQSGGSILGDKARMEQLSGKKEVYIRPSPSSGHLGGTSPKTHEVIMLAEAAGFNIIIVETVGVGQSEITIESMVDYILLLLLPGSGDELQGIKRGIMEIADSVAITKSDEADRAIMVRSESSCQAAIRLLPKKYSCWTPEVILSSAVTGQGIEEIWKNIQDFTTVLTAKGLFEQHRKKQLNKLFTALVDEQLRIAFYDHPEIEFSLQELAAKVEKNLISPFSGAQLLVKKFLSPPIQ
ncbi:LAO/AO transport system ATPase [Prosthecochloris aestuarii DSM 271]|uniref:LAO/AO transport system ATPase n=1 Tax=Prosthecochloris aestuarii (strain DSM 271 / SK 413) TaxID=290512 RepID=B4S782_PROA2|nr:methylmalonyl Co-A mutase-associated GTPase MeaB [Prosthecochloris aestuarii]ACF45919.1 LAO/AO transport system ATPase [Prosthecochloris aestuarii DSM 271]